MRACIQRVSYGCVEIISHEYFCEIQKGLVVLLGITHTDSIKEAEFLAKKCCKLRVFEDKAGKMNLSLNEIEGEILIVSQFTLYGNAMKGNRPNFTEAANPHQAENIYNEFIKIVQNELGCLKVKTGIFGAMMYVKIFNDGPVTIIIDSK